MSIADQCSDWLAQDLPGEIAYLIEIAPIARRDQHSRDGSTIGVLSPSSSWTRTVSHPVADVTPDQLRALADHHERTARELLEDAEELRGYADALEDETPLGRAMVDQFRVMRDEADHQKALREARYEAATNDGGVLEWDAVDRETRWKLYHAGLLTIDDVRRSLQAAELFDVKGIGPSRYRRIAAALAGQASDG